MDIILKKQDAEFHLIDGAPYLKGTVKYTRLDIGAGFSLSGANDVPIVSGDWTFFKDGDAGDAAFASITDLEDYMDSEFNRYLPYSRPYRVVSSADANASLIKQGRALLHKLSIINRSEATVYLKMYDISVTPMGTDTPVLTIPVVAKTEDTPIDVITSIMAFSYGIGIRISAAISDADETGITANEVTVNAVYQ